MRVKLRYVLINPLILIFFFFLGCSESVNDNHGISFKRDNHGNVVSKSPYLITQKGDTLVNGWVVIYYSNKNISDSFMVVMGKKNGQYFKYYDSGEINSVSELNDGMINGHVKYFFKNGTISIEQFYRNDSLLYSKEFFPNEQIERYSIFLVPNEFGVKLQTGYIIEYDSLGNKLYEFGDSTTSKRW